MTCGFEVVAFQKVLSNEIQRASEQKRLYLPLKEIKIDKDKTRRAMSLVPYLENEVIYFKEDMTDLIDEMLGFPSNTRHDDELDALIHAVSLIQENI